MPGSIVIRRSSSSSVMVTSLMAAHRPPAEHQVTRDAPFFVIEALDSLGVAVGPCAPGPGVGGDAERVELPLIP
jgi:hypothetical protein